MAPAMATARLRKELVKLQTEPPPGIIAEPDESNILKWYYAIRGPSDTGFDGGTYVGKLLFPSEYPWRPPSIYMLTPSGRFQVNTKLCMSMSDFHPESWNPLWSVSSIIQGIQSFMASDELTTGGLRSPQSEHKRLAALSMEYNEKMFSKLFGGNIEEAFEIADRARVEAVKKGSTQSQSKTLTNRSRRGRTRTSNSSTTKEEEQSKTETTAENGTDEHQQQQEQQKELTPEEIEKRRKRNQKKRAKQKAKKASKQAAKIEEACRQQTETTETIAA